MLEEESIWIKEVIEKADLSNVREVLDVGSSTKEVRTQTQPYIDENIFNPLRKCNISIYYLDKKKSEGVDLVYDIENVSADMIGKKFDLVICCNLLEHVLKPNKVASFLMDVVERGGYLLVTVPQTYRYHPDPIDTMFRPSMDELISMFAGLEIIRKATTRISDRNKYKLTELIRYLIPFLNWKDNCLFMRKE